MGKISDYPKVKTVDQEDTFLLDGSNGTKGILSRDLINGLLDQISTNEIIEHINLQDLTQTDKLSLNDLLLVRDADAGMQKKITVEDAFLSAMDKNLNIAARKCFYRGKSLGSVVTEEQYANIARGSFYGMFLGDYWLIGGIKWTIVDFDYWLGIGRWFHNKHHAVIMPLDPLYDLTMNDTDTSIGGYIGSKMFETGLSMAHSLAIGAFGEEHILHRDSLLSSVTDDSGEPIGVEFRDVQLVLPNEYMIFGVDPLSSKIKYSFHTTSDTQQLAGFRLEPWLIYRQKHYWLRDIPRPKYFCFVHSHGYPSENAANTLYGVRPVFGVI